MKKAEILSLIFAGCFIGWIITDLIINEYLEELNVTFTSHFQDQYASWLPFFKSITRWGADFGIFVISFLLYSIPKSKKNGAKMIFLAVICLYLQGTLKMIYAQPRPYMIHSEIHAYSCIQDFGRPSGHSISSVTIYLSFYLYFCNYKVDETTSIWIKIWNVVSFLFILAFIFSICLSRIFLGAHSVGQVLLGISYGSLLLILHFNYLDSYFEELFKRFSKKENKLENIKHVLARYLPALFTPLILYFSLHNRSNYDELYKDIADRCPNFTPNNLTFYEDHLVQTTVITTIFGFLLGFIVSSSNEEKPKDFELNFFIDELRMLLILLFIGAPMILFVGDYITFENLWLNYFGGILVTFICPFVLVNYVPYALLAFSMGRSNEYFVWEYNQPNVYAEISTEDTKIE